MEKCNQIQKQLKSLPVADDNYGLIHSDLHHGNFFQTDDKRLVMFDTDDSHYDWFIYDISIPLFYVMRDVSVGDTNWDYAKKFLGAFLDGYYLEYNLDRHWLAKLPLFLKLREMELYLVLYSENDLGPNDWCRRFMTNRREKIEQDMPVIDLDFAGIF